MRTSLIASGCALLLWNTSISAEVELPCLFSNSMVLQRDQPIRIWGKAASSSRITVRILDQTHQVTTGEDSRWSVTLTPIPAGGPHKLYIEGDGSELMLDDVMIGEVWLCSGQSNMAMTVNGVHDADTEMAHADLPAIRMFTVKSGHSTEPQEKCEGTWTVCHPLTVSGFSATAFFFGRRLHQELDVPIGLINSSVGGTSIESWTSMSAQTAVPELEPRIKAWQEADQSYDAERAKITYEQQLKDWEKQKLAAQEKGVRPPRRPQLHVQPHKDRNYPANLFNGRIHPIVGYTIRGVIWYQGENAANRGFAELYAAQLRTLVTDWRTRWGQGDIPFAWVQLPNFRAAQKEPCETSGWVLVQEGMRKALDLPNTGMAITIDLGESNELHPRNKQDVGSRLAQWALAKVYEKDVTPMGPVYHSAKREGNRMIIQFDHCGSALKSKGDGLKGFAIAGADRKFVWADAKIEHDKVIVWHNDIAEPVSVRYAWASNPVISLYNSADLPAAPFRSDDWPESSGPDR